MKQFLFFALAFIAIHNITKAQDTSPYWSLAGNSNVSGTTSKLGTANAVPLRLFTNNLERMRIDAAGNIGVNAISPKAKFHVNGYGAFGNQVSVANATRALNLADDNAVLRVLRVHASFAPAVELISRTSKDGANVAYWDFYAEPSDNSFRIRDRIGGGSGLNRLTIASNGYVGIGTTTPTQELHVVGSTQIEGRQVGLSVTANDPEDDINPSEIGIRASGDGGGVQGYATHRNGVGVLGSGGQVGVIGRGEFYGISGTTGFGDFGFAGVRGYSKGGKGVEGESEEGSGVHGESIKGDGVYGTSTTGYILKV